ncbi:MAG: hypothetical protein WB764_17160 [Xanthobacteraceae bacterium]
MQQQPFGYTFFADDVRQELFGKISLMGIYGSNLIISELPTIIPQIFFATYAHFPLEQRITNAKLQIYLPEDLDVPSIVVDLPDWTTEPDLEPAELPFADTELWAPFSTFQKLAPLVINQPGWIRLRIAYDEGRLRVGTLEVQFVPPKGKN